MVACSLWACQAPVEARLAAGDAAAREGRWADAQKEWTRASELDPSSAKALARAGYAAWQLGDRAKALAAWEQARGLSPQDPDARAGLALVALEARDAGSALELLTDDVTPLARLARARARLLRGGPGDAQAALDELQPLLAVTPPAAETTYLAGSAQVALRRYADAQATFERLQQAHPGSPLGPYGLARLAAAQERPTDALLHLAAARAAAPAAWRPEAVAADPAFGFLSSNSDFKRLVGK
jgi:tetratricopeptide (TPR) repeat protein